MFYTTKSKNSNKILLFHNKKVPITISQERNQNNNNNNNNNGTEI